MEQKSSNGLDCEKQDSLPFKPEEKNAKCNSRDCEKIDSFLCKPEEMKCNGLDCEEHDPPPYEPEKNNHINHNGWYCEKQDSLLSGPEENNAKFNSQDCQKPDHSAFEPEDIQVGCREWDLKQPDPLLFEPEENKVNSNVWDCEKQDPPPYDPDEKPANTQIGNINEKVEESKVKWKDINLVKAIQEFGKDTTLHGVKYIMEDGHLSRRLTWAIIICTVTAAFSYAIIHRVLLYYQYTTNTVLEIHYRDQLPFPTVTVCNQNPYKLTALQQTGLYDVFTHKYQDVQLRSIDKEKPDGSCIEQYFYNPVVCQLPFDTVYSMIHIEVTVDVCKQLCSYHVNETCSGFLFDRIKQSCTLTSFTGEDTYFYTEEEVNTLEEYCSTTKLYFYRRKRCLAPDNTEAISCTFEPSGDTDFHIDACRMFHETSTPANWVQRSGIDSTLKIDKGHYVELYETETRPNKVARLKSEYLDTTGKCIKLFVSIFGEAKGKLRLITMDESLKEHTLKQITNWMTGVNVWRAVTARLPNGMNKVIIEGARADRFSSGIGLDDITIDMCANLEHNCWNNADGADYTGHTEVADSGEACLRWDDVRDMLPQQPVMIADALLSDAHNHCRYDFYQQKLGCFVMDNGLSFKKCEIPQCTCEDGEFQCVQSGFCINKELTCDGKYDCLDESDEGNICTSLQDISCDFESGFMCGYTRFRGNSEQRWASIFDASIGSSNKEAHYLGVESNGNSLTGEISLIYTTPVLFANDEIVTMRVKTLKEAKFHEIAWIHGTKGTFNINNLDGYESGFIQNVRSTSNDWIEYDICMPGGFGVTQSLIFQGIYKRGDVYMIDSIDRTHKPCSVNLNKLPNEGENISCSFDNSNCSYVAFSEHTEMKWSYIPSSSADLALKLYDMKYRTTEDCNINECTLYDGNNYEEILFETSGYIQSPGYPELASQLKSDYTLLVIMPAGVKVMADFQDVKCNTKRNCITSPISIDDNTNLDICNNQITQSFTSTGNTMVVKLHKDANVQCMFSLQYSAVSSVNTSIDQAVALTNGGKMSGKPFVSWLISPKMEAGLFQCLKLNYINNSPFKIKQYDNNGNGIDLFVDNIASAAPVWKQLSLTLTQSNQGDYFVFIAEISSDEFIKYSVILDNIELLEEGCVEKQQEHKTVNDISCNFEDILQCDYVDISDDSIKWARDTIKPKEGSIYLPPEKCVLPFTYSGKLYNGCTRVDYHRHWCSSSKFHDVKGRVLCDEPSSSVMYFRTYGDVRSVQVGKLISPFTSVTEEIYLGINFGHSKDMCLNVQLQNKNFELVQDVLLKCFDYSMNRNDTVLTLPVGEYHVVFRTWYQNNPSLTQPVYRGTYIENVQIFPKQCLRVSSQIGRTYCTINDDLKGLACLEKSCCLDESAATGPWCFKTAPRQCPVTKSSVARTRCAGDFTGITEQQCYGLRDLCCWDNTSTGMSPCYKPVPRKCPVTVPIVERVFCPGSYRGITVNECYNLRENCCWDDSVESQPSCYFPVPRTCPFTPLPNIPKQNCPGYREGMTQTDCYNLEAPCCWSTEWEGPWCYVTETKELQMGPDRTFVIGSVYGLSSTNHKNPAFHTLCTEKYGGKLPKIENESILDLFNAQIIPQIGPTTFIPYIWVGGKTNKPKNLKLDLSDPLHQPVDIAYTCITLRNWRDQTNPDGLFFAWTRHCQEKADSFACEKSTSGVSLYATCSGSMTVYKDGVKSGTSNSYSETRLVRLSQRTSIVGIECVNDRGPVGIVGTFSDGTTTDTYNWRCSNQLHDGWNSKTFNHSDWSLPLGFRSKDNWKTFGISNDADIIWTKGGIQDKHVYCVINMKDIIRYTFPPPHTEPTTESVTHQSVFSPSPLVIFTTTDLPNVTISTINASEPLLFTFEQEQTSQSQVIIETSTLNWTPNTQKRSTMKIPVSRNTINATEPLLFTSEQEQTSQSQVIVETSTLNLTPNKQKRSTMKIPVSELYISDEETLNLITNQQDDDFAIFSKDVSFRRDDLFLSCNWAGEECPPGALQGMFTDMGYCYTFNGENQINSTKSGLLHGLQLTLNVKEYELVEGISSDSGIKVHFYGPNEEPIMKSMGYAVSPGTRTLFNLKYTTGRYMEPTYGTCGKNETDLFPGVEYSTSHCIIQCEMENLKHICNCSLPFINGARNVNGCTVTEYLTCVLPVEGSSNGQFCNCFDACNQVAYEAQMSYSSLSGLAVNTLLNDKANIENQYLEALNTQNRLAGDIYSNFMTDLKSALEACKSMEQFLLTRAKITFELAQKGMQYMINIALADIDLAVQLKYSNINAFWTYFTIENNFQNVDINDLIFMTRELEFVYNQYAVNAITKRYLMESVISQSSTFITREMVDLRKRFEQKINNQLQTAVDSLKNDLNSTYERILTDVINKDSAQGEQAIRNISQNMKMWQKPKIVVKSGIMTYDATPVEFLQVIVKGKFRQFLVLKSKMYVNDIIKEYVGELRGIIQEQLSEFVKLESTILTSVSRLEGSLLAYQDSIQLDSEFVRNNIMQIEVFFGELKQTSIEQLAGYGIGDFFGDLGGYLGLLLGASIVTMCEILDFIIYKVIRMCPHKKTD